MKTLIRLFTLCLLAASLAAPLRAQDEILPNENLVAEGIPKIPAALAASVERYTNARNAVFESWDPQRRAMLISTRFADTAQIHSVAMPGGARTQLTFYPERVAGATFAPQGGFFIFLKDIGGGEFYQIYRQDLATGEATLLTDGKSRNVGARFSKTGKWLAFSSTRRNGNDLDLWVVDPMKPDSVRMVTQLQGGGWETADWSPDDHKILMIEGISVSESYLWLVDVASGEKTLLTPKGGPKVAYSGGQFSKDGKGLYVTTDRESEFLRLTYFDLQTHNHRYLTSHISWDVEGFDLSNDGKTLAFLTNEDGLSVLHLLDTASSKEKAAPKLPVGVIAGVEWHKNNRDLALTLISARGPADVYSLDTQTAKLERWTFSESGGMRTDDLPEPELIRWKSFDGRMISGFVYRPAAKFTGKRPVIIDIHGGPEGQSRPEFLGAENYYLKELGVAIIFPNVRGSTGFGKTFQDLDNGFLREGSYQDINALFDWIGTRADLDAGRILISGGSYGGFMTLAVATTYNDRICCSVDIVGPSNLVTFLEHTSGYRQDLRRVEYGDERDPKMREFLERIAPMNKARNITKPLFVIAGKNDPRVPASESEQMVATVRQNGTSVWWLLGKNEGHGFSKKKNRDFEFYSTLMFVKKYLLGETGN
jgi:dipeptidyl aminopeptidase/acylaminoacyl peptidase